jgi:hypothetical protein
MRDYATSAGVEDIRALCEGNIQMAYDLIDQDRERLRLRLGHRANVLRIIKILGV